MGWVRRERNMHMVRMYERCTCEKIDVFLGDRVFYCFHFKRSKR